MNLKPFREDSLEAEFEMAFRKGLHYHKSITRTHLSFFRTLVTETRSGAVGRTKNRKQAKSLFRTGLVKTRNGATSAVIQVTVY